MIKMESSPVNCEREKMYNREYPLVEREALRKQRFN